MTPDTASAANSLKAPKTTTTSIEPQAMKYSNFTHLFSLSTLVTALMLASTALTLMQDAPCPLASACTAQMA